MGDKDRDDDGRKLDENGIGGGGSPPEPPPGSGNPGPPKGGNETKSFDEDNETR